MAVTLPGTIRRGSVLVVCASALRALGAPTLSVADSLGHTYATGPTQTFAAGLRRHALFYVANTEEGQNTVTVTPSVTSDLVATVTELGGSRPLSPLVGTLSATGTGLTPTGPLTPAEAPALIVGSFTHTGLDTSLTPGSGFTAVAEVEGGTVLVPMQTEIKLVGHGITTVDGTIGLSVDWSLLAMAFAEWNLMVPVGLHVAGSGARAAVATGVI